MLMVVLRPNGQALVGPTLSSALFTLPIPRTPTTCMATRLTVTMQVLERPLIQGREEGRQ